MMNRGQHLAREREQTRQQLWPDAEQDIWSRHGSKGFTTVPRILPLILNLIGDLTPKGKGNPARAYLDLWFRAFDEGFVEISDEEECAFASGYDSSRARRTWAEHIRHLEQLGFVRVAPKGRREIGYVLLLNPYRVAAGLRTHGKVPENWWNEFRSRAQKIGAWSPSFGEDNPVSLPQSAKVPRSSRKRAS